MAALKYIIIHCADTYPSFPLSKEVLEEWHKGPRDSNGKVIYLGKEYPNRASLPPDLINGKPISTLFGRGWDRLGYTFLFHREGGVETLTPNDGDDFITNSEMTWGATGFNANGIHVCLEGGRVSKPTPQPKFKGGEVVLFTPAQLEDLEKFLVVSTVHHPQVEILGHYQTPGAGKTCPNFDVPEYLKLINLAKFAYKPK